MSSASSTEITEFDLCVVGNLLTDLVLRGVEEMPKWGCEVMASESVSLASGQCGLLAQALAALGLTVRTVSTVGDDERGRATLATLRDAGVDVGAVETSTETATGLTVVLVRPDGERAFVTVTGALADCDETTVLRHWDASAGNVVCFVGLNNLPSLTLPAVGRLLARAHLEGRTTMLDTGWDTEGWRPETVRSTRAVLAAVDVFIPNLEEARALTDCTSPEDAAATLAEETAGVVVVKCGPDGAVAHRGDKSWSAPAHPVEVVDTVGAGDVFDAGFLHGYLETDDVAIGLRRGNAAAAHYISRSARRFPSRAELSTLIADAPVSTSPIPGREGEHR